MRQKVTFLLVLVLSSYGRCNEFKQDRARVLYLNPNVVKDMNMFTFREGRNTPYLTSLNMTLLVPIGNNVTFQFEVYNSKMGFPLRLELKTCELLKQEWSKDWLKIYTTVPPTCPVQPGFFQMTRFELPPRNFPLALSNVDYTAKCLVFITSSKEKVVELYMELKFNKKKKANK